MAQKVQVLLVDDIDGGDAEETVSYALDGVSYEIDLSSANAAKLRDAFALYVGSSRRVGGRSGGGGGSRSGAGGGGSRRAARSGGNRTGEVREWAKANGYQVNERGRVPRNVQDAYDKAHA